MYGKYLILLDVYQGQESSQQTIRGKDDFLLIHEMLSLKERKKERKGGGGRHQTSSY